MLTKFRYIVYTLFGLSSSSSLYIFKSPFRDNIIPNLLTLYEINICTMHIRYGLSCIHKYAAKKKKNHHKLCLVLILKSYLELM